MSVSLYSMCIYNVYLFISHLLLNVKLYGCLQTIRDDAVELRFILNLVYIYIYISLFFFFAFPLLLRLSLERIRSMKESHTDYDKGKRDGKRGIIVSRNQR